MLYQRIQMKQKEISIWNRSYSLRKSMKRTRKSNLELLFFKNRNQSTKFKIWSSCQSNRLTMRFWTRWDSITWWSKAQITNIIQMLLMIQTLRRVRLSDLPRKLLICLSRCHVIPRTLSFAELIVSVSISWKSWSWEPKEHHMRMVLSFMTYTFLQTTQMRHHSAYWRPQEVEKWGSIPISTSVGKFACHSSVPGVEAQQKTGTPSFQQSCSCCFQFRPSSCQMRYTSMSQGTSTRWIRKKAKRRTPEA